METIPQGGKMRRAGFVVGAGKFLSVYVLFGGYGNPSGDKQERLAMQSRVKCRRVGMEKES